jgi:hypothetical protein
MRFTVVARRSAHFLAASQQNLGEEWFRQISRTDGDKRNHRIPDTPTIWELMDQEKGDKGIDAKKRLARVVLGPGAFGRPILATPGIRPIASNFCAMLI